ncbi:hypothetical protein ACFV0Y_16865 [Streptomyces sp. NPDC059569]|uniref:hypothetical protein n=1 Tax=Streptomyces sp. NPDC059569 TaxID=3346869 RepID=UPI0036B18ED3
MTTEIAETTPGRGLTHYDLADEAIETYNLTLKDAHETISSLLTDLVNDDPDVILDRQPMRPDLAVSNPADVDVYHWLTVSDETADTIRGALAAIYA